MIQATYAINEFVKTAISNTNSVGMIFYPGDWAPQNPGDNFIVYNVVPTTDFHYFMVHTDRIKYKVHNTNFDILNQIIHTILTTLNVDNIQNSGLIEPGIKFKMTFANPTNTNQAIYIEGNNYFVTTIDIMVIYTEST